MKLSERSLSLILVVVLLVIGVLWGYFQNTLKPEIKFPYLAPYQGQETTDLSEKAIEAGEDFIPDAEPGKTNYDEKTILVDEDFSSHLPIILIDTNDVRPDMATMWDPDLHCQVPIPDVDPYVFGSVKILNHANFKGVNTLRENADQSCNMKIKIRGNSSSLYDKKQYKLKLVDAGGKSVRENLLGMGADNEWILTISLADKSLLRNFLGLSVAREVMDYTPDSRFCEVIWKDSEGYHYEGLYMLTESIKVGKNRLDIPRYHENTDNLPMLLRRDRFNANGIMLENYSRIAGFNDKYLELQYPDAEHITEKSLKQATAFINNFEQVLYSEDRDVFFNYRNLVDMDSFVDYFIINEFFMNYDAGHFSTYAYVDSTNLIHMGPVWDFDQAIDNGSKYASDCHTTAAHSAPWFDQILKDPVFTYLVEQRYHELRQSILSDESVESFVNSAIAHLGPAIDRDWARWGYYYQTDLFRSNVQADAVEHTKTHRQDVDRLLRLLKEHGDWMDENIDSLYQFKCLDLQDAVAQMKSLDAEKPSRIYNNLFAVIFVSVFLISVILVLRHESE